MQKEVAFIGKIVARQRTTYIAVAVLAATATAFFSIANVAHDRSDSNKKVSETTNFQAVSVKPVQAIAQNSGATFNASAGANPEEATDVSREAAYQGVSFSYHTSLASEVKAETKPALPLEAETDKAEGVVPEHISFTFIGPYASQHPSSYFSPEISVYPIAEKLFGK